MNRFFLIILLSFSLNALAENDCKSTNTDTNCKNEMSILNDIKPEGLKIVEATVSAKGLIVTTVKTSDKKILNNFIYAVKNNKIFTTVKKLNLGQTADSDEYYLYIGVANPSASCHPYTKPSVATLSC
jgi:hypothetical protein